MTKKKFELLVPIWQNASEQLPAGSILTFEDDEPTGIFIDRVKELVAGGEPIEVASPKKTGKSAEVDPPAPPAPKK